MGLGALGPWGSAFGKGWDEFVNEGISYGPSMNISLGCFHFAGLDEASRSVFSTNAFALSFARFVFQSFVFACS